MSDLNNKEWINDTCREISKDRNIGLLAIEEYDNDALTYEVHEVAQSELEKTFNSYMGYKAARSNVVFLSLTLIALHSYDSNFYDYVRQEYRKLYAKHNSQKIESTIREIIRKYKRSDVDDSKRLITSVLMNAIVPKYFLPDFFDFAFDIYKLNLSFSTNNIDKELHFVFDGLYKILRATEDTDELKLNVRDTSYHLIQSTKKFIISEKKNNFENAISFTKNIISIIHNNYLSNSDSEFDNSYYEYGYNKWVAKHTKSAESLSDKKRKLSPFISRSEPFVYYDRNNKKFMFCPPEHKFRDEVDQTQLYVRIYNGTKEVYRNNLPEILPIFGGYKIVSHPIEIEDPIGELRYVLNEGKKTIYDTKDRFKKPVFVFDVNNGTNIKNYTDFSGDVLLCYKQTKENFHILEKKKYYTLGYKTVEAGDVYYFDNKEPFVFSKMIKPGITADRIEGLYIESDGKRLDVYKNFTYLIFESSLDAESIGVCINGKKFRLTNYNYRFNKKELWTQYIVPLQIDSTGVYRIYAFDIKTGARIKNTDFEFGVDKNYHSELQRISSENYKVQVTSGFLDSCQNVDLNINDVVGFEIPFIYESLIYLYKIPLNLELYKIDNGQWKTFDSSIWVDDFNINSTLSIWGKTESIMLLGFDDATPKPLETVTCTIKDNVSIASIGCLKSYGSYSKVLLMWCDSEGKEKGIWQDNTCEINKRKTILDFDPVNNVLNFSLNYYGKGPLDFEIMDVNENQIFKKEGMNNGDKLQIKGLKTLRDYKFRVKWKIKNGFFKKENVLFDVQKKFYSFDDLVNSTFTITNITYKRTLNGNSFKEETYEGKVGGIGIIGRESDRIFIANVYDEYGNIRILKDSISPVKVEIISDIHEGEMEALLTGKGDKNLRFNLYSKKITNNMFESSGDEILSYTMKFVGK